MSQINVLGSTPEERGARILQGGDKTRDQAVTYANITLGRIGFWSALLTVLCSITYGVAVIVLMVYTLTHPSQSQGWSGIDTFLAEFQPIQMLPAIPSLPLVITFTALMVCIHSYAAEERKIWSRLGLSFTLIYATMAGINYLVQLMPVWRSIAGGESDGLAMFVLGNPHSLFWGLAYAYIFMQLAMLFTAPVFVGGPLEKRIRFILLLNGILMIVTLASAILDSPPFYLLGSLVTWCPAFTAAAASLALLFGRLVEAGRKA